MYIHIHIHTYTYPYTYTNADTDMGWHFQVNKWEEKREENANHVTA